MLFEMNYQEAEPALKVGFLTFVSPDFYPPAIDQISLYCTGTDLSDGYC